MATKLSPSLETEAGHAQGLGYTKGWPWDPAEWSPELAWPQSVRVFGQMRTQDGKIASTLDGIKLPIRRTRWALDPNGARDEVVRVCQEDLVLPLLGEEAGPPPARSRGKLRFTDHLRLALLSLDYGHAVFEQVYDIRDGLARLVRLAPRLPETIAKINTTREGDLESIEQYPTGIPGDTGPYITIPANRLVFYSHEREGGVWQGRSILRRSYKHWIAKDRLIRVAAMTAERNGMGVPIIVAPEGATQPQMADLNKLAQSYRAGEASGGAIPHGGELKLVGVSGQLPDVLAQLKYHDAEIAGGVLEQFLELGRTAHGSRALGASFIDFFILAQQAVADEIAHTATADIVEDLVDLNWGPDEPSPRIVVAEIGEEHELTAMALMQLVESGALTNDEGLEDYIRENYRLPALSGPARPGYGSKDPQGAGTGQGGEAAAASRGKAAAGSTPATAKQWPGWKMDRRLVHYHAPVIARALGQAIDVKAATRAYRSAVTASAETHEVALARSFLVRNAWDLSSADDALADLYGTAYVAGARAARLSIPRAAQAAVTTTKVPLPEWEAEIDWSAWTPGDLRAAAELLGVDGGRGLRGLLDQASVTISSVADHRLDDLASALANGVADGDSVTKIAASLSGILSDPSRAEMIANTEVARAMTSATLDTYAANGIGLKEVITSDPCPECQENEDAGAIPLDDDFPAGDPPSHPNCRCAVLPVVDMGDNATPADEATAEGEG